MSPAAIPDRSLSAPPTNEGSCGAVSAPSSENRLRLPANGMEALTLNASLVIWSEGSAGCFHFPLQAGSGLWNVKLAHKAVLDRQYMAAAHVKQQMQAMCSRRTRLIPKTKRHTFSCGAVHMFAYSVSSSVASAQSIYR